MKIADVTAVGLSSLIDPPRTYQFEEETRKIRKRDVILVFIETASGEVGSAPCGTGAFTKWEEFNEATHDDIASVINDIIGPKLEGETIESVEAAHDIIRSNNLPEYLRWQASGAIDVALYDILGKQTGEPVYELLEYDVEPSTSLELYASSGLYLSPDAAAEEAATLADRGFTAYKYRAGLGIEKDRRTIERVREAVGDEVDVMVDAHAWWSRGEPAYSREEIRSLVEYMGEHDVYWVEEPVPSDDYKAFRELSETTGVPIAGGENEDTPGGLVNVAELGGLSFLQGDVKQHGGYTGCRQAIEFCRENPVAYVPHNYGTHLGVVANAHLAAAAPGCDFIEFPIYETDDVTGMYPFPLASDIISTDLEITDGRLSVPSGPGLGVTVDRDVIEEYPYVDGRWSENVSL